MYLILRNNFVFMKCDFSEETIPRLFQGDYSKETILRRLFQGDYSKETIPRDYSKEAIPRRLFQGDYSKETNPRRLFQETSLLINFWSFLSSK